MPEAAGSPGIPPLPKGLDSGRMSVRTRVSPSGVLLRLGSCVADEVPYPGATCIVGRVPFSGHVTLVSWDRRGSRGSISGLVCMFPEATPTQSSVHSIGAQEWRWRSGGGGGGLQVERP